MLHFDPVTRVVDQDPTAADFFQNPYPFYEKIRAQSPVFYWKQYGFWCFLDHTDVSALLRDRRFGRQISHIASRAELGQAEHPAHVKPFYDVDDRSMLQLEPPAHTRLRTLVNRAFVSRQVEKLRPQVEALAHQLIDDFPGHSVDLLAHFATPIPALTIAQFLGVPRAMVPKLLEWSHAMVAMYQFGRNRAIEDSAVAATLEFSAYLRQLLHDKRQSPADDLISALTHAAPDGESLTEDELIGTCILLLNAGHEASVHAFCNGVKSALESGFDRAAAFATPAATADFVEEILRFDAPLHLFDRYVLEDLSYGGLNFKKGDKIGLMLGAANRDPAKFQNPDRFDPARAQNAHVSFGGGIHFCIGAPLARLELQTGLKVLFQRLPDLHLATKPRYRNAYHFHGLEALELAF